MSSPIQVQLINGTDPWTVVAALGSILASVVALSIALWSAYERRRRDEESQLTEARQIYTLILPPASGARIINGSRAPIFRVNLIGGDVRPGAYAGAKKWRWMHGNGAMAAYVEALLPGEHHDFGGWWTTVDNPVPLVKEDGNQLAPPLAAMSWFTITVRWSDAQGTRWERTGNGEPERCGEERDILP